MARKKTIKKTPVILRNALSVYERSITRFSDVVCQFTVQNGNQISYDILEVSPDPDPTPRVERSITRFKEVVCEFVVIDGTDVHAYELEPVYADITGGSVDNFDKVGNPTIENGILTTSEGNFIKTPQAFNPGSDPWEIQVKYKYNTAINNADVAGSVDSNNASINGVLLEMRTNKSVSGYLSSNGTSWDLSNNLGQTYAIDTTSNTWILAKLEYTGTQYKLSISIDDGDTWNQTGTLASSTPVIGSYPIAFGLKRNNTMDGNIDLNACKIYINNQLWWEAYN